jgi:hypothetical protein
MCPPHQRRGGTHSPGGEGEGSIFSEDARHWIGLLQYNPSTPIPLLPPRTKNPLNKIEEAITVPYNNKKPFGRHRKKQTRPEFNEGFCNFLEFTRNFSVSSPLFIYGQFMHKVTRTKFRYRDRIKSEPKIIMILTFFNFFMTLD